jgi:hypothetical protein
MPSLAWRAGTTTLFDVPACHARIYKPFIRSLEIDSQPGGPV